MRQLFFSTIFIIPLTFISLTQTATKLNIEKETLFCWSGDFIEFKKKQNMYNIEKIKYQTTRCFGTCPQFYLEIDKLKNATLDAKYHNRKDKKGKEIKGKYNAIIKDKDYDEIVKLLNDINFPNLNDNYAVAAKDYPTCFLTITYNNGKVKKIRDYGLNGTSGLKKLYNLMFELRFNQEWKKSKGKL
ncbi:MAG: DUF6438 domain-containing protein [Bacteroidota bacterium]